MAPELILDIHYKGSQVDIFALGVILFAMVVGHPPFSEAHYTDPFYQLIAGNQSELFWKTHLKRRTAQDPDGITLSESVKSLIISMLQYMPEHRPTMSEIFGHDWLRSCSNAH